MHVNLKHVLCRCQQSQLCTLVVWVLHGGTQRMHETWYHIVSNCFALSHQLLLRGLVTIGSTSATGCVD